MVWARTCRKVQPEIPSRNATMGSILSELAAVCGPSCANDDAFGTAQGPEYLLSDAKRCNLYTPSEPICGLRFDGSVNCIVCSVSLSCYFVCGSIDPHLFASRWSMEQIPDVVMVLLLIGVDMNTTTELRSDILYSISLMCRRLPAEPVDGIVRRYP